jgi:hypothetical protein
LQSNLVTRPSASFNISETLRGLSFTVILIMSSSRRKNIKRRPKTGRGTGLASAGTFSAMAVVTGRNTAFKLTQTTSGVGCISNNNTGPTLSSLTSVYIDPYTIGSRCALLAAEFAQYRIRAMTIQYRTDATNSGVVNSQSGPTTTPSYGSRPFAMGWSKDPTIAPATAVSIVEIGGFSHNTSRDAKPLRLPSSPWLFTSSAASYPASAADIRLAAHGIFCAAFIDASTTAAATYGRFELTWEVEYRYPLNASVIGEEEKLDISDITIVARQSRQLLGKEDACQPPIAGSVKEEPNEKKVASTPVRYARNMLSPDPTKGATGWFS